MFRDLSKGPHFSYELNHSFQPWDELSESNSYKTNLSWINTYNIMHTLADQGKKSPEETRAVVIFHNYQLKLLRNAVQSNITQLGDQRRLTGSIRATLTPAEFFSAHTSPS